MQGSLPHSVLYNEHVRGPADICSPFSHLVNLPAIYGVTAPPSGQITKGVFFFFQDCRNVFSTPMFKSFLSLYHILYVYMLIFSLTHKHDNNPPPPFLDEIPHLQVPHSHNIKYL